VTLSDSLCVGGCSQEETINDLFMDCEFFSGTWRLVLGLLGVSTFAPPDNGSHAL